GFLSPLASPSAFGRERRPSETQPVTAAFGGFLSPLASPSAFGRERRPSETENEKARRSGGRCGGPSQSAHRGLLARSVHRGSHRPVAGTVTRHARAVNRPDGPSLKTRRGGARARKNTGAPRGAGL